MISDGLGNTTELHSFTCCHCGNPKTVAPGKKIEDVSDICRSCWKLHCLSPECCDRCVPFMKKVEAVEARYESLRSMGLV
jgi:hypothetical protein